MNTIEEQASVASKLGIDLRKHSVSDIDTDGLNFDAFLLLFGENALQVPVAVITDSDPLKIYPKPDEVHPKSAPSWPLKHAQIGT